MSLGRRSLSKSRLLGFIELTFIASEEEGGYVSTCPELGIASQGKTVDEAFENLKDATQVYLETIQQLGERERVFKERHIRIRRTEPKEAKTLKLQPSQVASVFVAPVEESRQPRKTSLVGTR
jgi:predicted RNase H-like HicB family nuclease